MQKMFANRPILYATLAFGLGIFLAKPIFSADIIAILFVLVGFGAITYLCFRFACVYRLMIIAVCFIIGMGAFFISMASLGARDFGDDEYKISGRIAVVTTYTTSQSVMIDNVHVAGKKIDKNMVVYISDVTELEEGCVISFTSTIDKTDYFVLGSFNTYNYKYNIAYSSSVNFEDVTIDQKNVLDWAERLRLSVKYMLFNNMEKEQASVSYASLFGDKSNISDDTKAAFSVTGIAHLLAISGLHIGFIVAVLKRLLNLFRLKDLSQYVVIVVALCFYCYLCSFSASVVRAAVMFAVAGLWSYKGHKNDSLSTLSLAALVCLFFRPLTVYDGGFLLSFACALCIFMFSTTLQKKLEKIGFPKWLASTFGVMIPVQVGLIPLLSNYFTSVSLLSILANFVCVPLFEIFFMALFLLVPICLIIPTLGFLFTLPSLMIGWLINFASVLAGLDWAIINMTAFASMATVGIYFGIFVCSQFLHTRTLKKGIVATIICSIALVFGICATFSVAPKDKRITILSSYGTTVYCIELDGVSFAVGEFDNGTIKLAKNHAGTSRLYAYDYFISFTSNYSSDETIFKNIYTHSNLETLSDKDFVGVDVETKYINDKFAGLAILGKDTSIFICNSEKFSYAEYYEFGYFNHGYDIILGLQEYASPYLPHLDYDYYVHDGQNLLSSSNKILHSRRENWYFEWDNDKICNVRGVD